MILNTQAILATFLAPFLQKAEPKITEKIVESIFDSRKDLTEKFKRLLKTEIISLNLGDFSSAELINKELASRTELREEISRKIVANPDLLNEVIKAFKQMPHVALGEIIINESQEEIDDSGVLCF